MKLEVGKTYRRRDGVEDTVIDKIHNGRFSFVTESGRTYAHDGRWLFGAIEHQLDFVEEVCEIKQSSCDLGTVRFNTLETLGSLRHLLCFAQGLVLGMNHSGKHSFSVQTLRDARLVVEEIEAAIRAEQAS